MPLMLRASCPLCVRRSARRVGPPGKVSAASTRHVPCQSGVPLFVRSAGSSGGNDSESPGHPARWASTPVGLCPHPCPRIRLRRGAGVGAVRSRRSRRRSLGRPSVKGGVPWVHCSFSFGPIVGSVAGVSSLTRLSPSSCMVAGSASAGGSVRAVARVRPLVSRGGRPPGCPGGPSGCLPRRSLVVRSGSRNVHSWCVILRTTKPTRQRCPKNSCDFLHFVLDSTRFLVYAVSRTMGRKHRQSSPFPLKPGAGPLTPASSLTHRRLTEVRLRALLYVLVLLAAAGGWLAIHGAESLRSHPYDGPGYHSPGPNVGPPAGNGCGYQIANTQESAHDLRKSNR